VRGVERARVDRARRTSASTERPRVFMSMVGVNATGLPSEGSRSSRKEEGAVKASVKSLSGGRRESGRLQRNDVRAVSRRRALREYQEGTNAYHPSRWRRRGRPGASRRQPRPRLQRARKVAGWISLMNDEGGRKHRTTDGCPLQRGACVCRHSPQACAVRRRPHRRPTSGATGA
jgi:hypothetical protein